MEEQLVKEVFLNTLLILHRKLRELKNFKIHTIRHIGKGNRKLYSMSFMLYTTPVTLNSFIFTITFNLTADGIMEGFCNTKKIFHFDILYEIRFFKKEFPILNDKELIQEMKSRYVGLDFVLDIFNYIRSTCNR